MVDGTLPRRRGWERLVPAIPRGDGCAHPLAQQPSDDDDAQGPNGVADADGVRRLHAYAVVGVTGRRARPRELHRLGRLGVPLGAVAQLVRAPDS